LRLSNSNWIRAEISGKIAKERAYHHTFYNAGQLMVFGGLNQQGYLHYDCDLFTLGISFDLGVIY
jgi:hypothetical protein